MTPVAAEVSITAIIPMLTAIANRQWEQFKELEADFVSQYGVEVWQEVFNFRLKPALDKDSDRWLLIQWCGEGIISVKNVA
ncbi:hypothetical protein [Nostoc sp. DedSLP04]|uniref:hypothetical protein n=1 Tax=Nostoc sp. DedSLP04 TaxID=3075401 RepID=UPI002AD41237|nr:hypothetical protein [Nostoc sp. DedSLP04]MDZ8035883.1 hypothetical protein [Nostoc sp. DedSLP04]